VHCWLWRGEDKEDFVDLCQSGARELFALRLVLVGLEAHARRPPDRLDAGEGAASICLHTKGDATMAREGDKSGRWASGADLGLAIVRVAVSTILLWGALTKLGDGERIEALAAVWAAAGVPQAHLLVTLSIGLQLVLALLLLVGLYARMAGVLVGANFAAAAAVSGIFAGANGWAFGLLIVLLLNYGLLGGGRLSLDALLRRRLAPASPASGSVEDLLAKFGVEPVAQDTNNPGVGRG
jgi:uncharacterized membrane protein YphA (DoxX/SURF4 family)